MRDRPTFLATSWSNNTSDSSRYVALWRDNFWEIGYEHITQGMVTGPIRADIEDTYIYSKLWKREKSTETFRNFMRNDPICRDSNKFYEAYQTPEGTMGIMQRYESSNSSLSAPDHIVHNLNQLSRGEIKEILKY